MPRTCPRCGVEAADDDRFCSSCGERLPVPVDSTGEQPVAPLGAADATGVLGVRAASAGDSGPVPVVDAGVVHGLPAGAALLMVRRGPYDGTQFVLAGTPGTAVTVGRSPDSALFLDDVTVSRRHAEFRRDEHGWSVHDVGSLNGTYVDRRRTEGEPLRGGEEVQVGKYRFLFLLAVDEGA